MFTKKLKPHICSFADFAYKIYTMIGEDKFEYYSFIFKKGFCAYLIIC